MATLQQDGTQQYRILLVEDNPGDVRLVREMFRELGSGRYEMVEANRLEQALVQLARQSFDLALLDLSLPDATGLDGLRQLQELAQDLPIVVLTGLDDQDLALEALRRGAQNYLLKGKIDTDTLRREVGYSVERKKLEVVLRESEQRYSDLFNQSLGLLCTHDLDGSLLSVNPAGAGQLGYETAELIGRNLRELVTPQFRLEFDGYLERIRSSGSDSGYLSLNSRKGNFHIFAYRNTLHQDRKGVPYIIGYAQDVTAQRDAQAALRASENRFRTLAAHAPVGIFMTDAAGECIYVNPRWCEISGVTLQEANGQSWTRALHPDDKQRIANAWATMADGENNLPALEYRHLHPDGKLIWVTGNVAALRDKDEKLSGYIGTVSDISALKQVEEKLHDLSLRDELTGLHNRRGFLSLAEHSLKLAQREGENLAVFFVDIDGMKQINDGHGHEEGDRALVATAEILRRSFRDTDVIGRLGGDEFVVLQRERKQEGSEQAQRRLQQAIESFNASAKLPYPLKLSVGVTCQNPDTQVDIDILLSAADARMYEIKRAKRQSTAHSQDKRI